MARGGEWQRLRGWQVQLFISDEGSWIIWKEDNTNFALDSQLSAPADSHPNTHIHIPPPPPPDTLLFVYLNVGQKCVHMCFTVHVHVYCMWQQRTHSALWGSPDTTINMNLHANTHISLGWWTASAALGAKYHYDTLSDLTLIRAKNHIDAALWYRL